MVIFWIIVAAIFGAALFMVGPYLIEAVVDKIDQWADIIDAFMEEK